MTIEIPVWVLWTLGIFIGVPMTIFVIGCAIVGALFLWNFEGPKW